MGAHQHEACYPDNDPSDAELRDMATVFFRQQGIVECGERCGRYCHRDRGLCEDCYRELTAPRPGCDDTL